MKVSFSGISVFSLALLAAAAFASPGTAHYYAIEEPFTINFLRQSDQQARYLQIRVVLRSTDPQISTHAETHLPMIQDQLRLLFSRQTFDSLQTLEGRQQLQQSANTLINTLFETELNQTYLDTVYFTGFIWQ